MNLGRLRTLIVLGSISPTVADTDIIFAFRVLDVNEQCEGFTNLDDAINRSDLVGGKMEIRQMLRPISPGDPDDNTCSSGFKQQIK